MSDGKGSKHTVTTTKGEVIAKPTSWPWGGRTCAGNECHSTYTNTITFYVKCTAHPTYVTRGATTLCSRHTPEKGEIYTATRRMDIRMYPKLQSIK